MAYGINETEYKGCIIKTMESGSQWDWKIDTKFTGLIIIMDSGSSYSESSAIDEAKRKIDDEIRSTW